MNQREHASLDGDQSNGRGPRTVTLFLCGDVMTGRGIDHVLPHPCDPRLHEPWARSAADYVDLAQAAHGAIERPVAFSYVWGDAIAELRRARPDARIVNLETAVTAGEDRAAKGIHYRMSPRNAACITAAGIDVCTLANNHVLDWGQSGLIETLSTLEEARVRTAGAGRDLDGARAPAVVPVRGGGRVLVFAFATAESGIPAHWAATPTRAGIDLLPGLSPRSARRIARSVRAVRRPGDVVVASIHWGGNWGYDIPDAQRAFAHALVDDAGVDVVHGHSSHHPKGIEVHRGRPILYGCGDFLNDYEGIRGHASYRGDLSLMYLVVLDAGGGLRRLAMRPMQIRGLRLNTASRRDAAWLRDTLDRESEQLGAGVALDASGTLVLSWD